MFHGIEKNPSIKSFASLLLTFTENIKLQLDENNAIILGYGVTRSVFFKCHWLNAAESGCTSLIL